MITILGHRQCPRGPKGEKRPADVIGNAVRVMRIATGEAEERGPDTGIEFARRGGLEAGKARAKACRAKALTPQRRREIQLRGRHKAGGGSKD